MGTGYSEDVLAKLANKMSSLRVSKSPFQPSLGTNGLTWVRSNLVAQVAFAE
ncbi:MAG: hypothetical protein ACLQU3_05000 [Limisphaerales bacterium]